MAAGVGAVLLLLLLLVVCRCRIHSEWRLLVSLYVTCVLVLAN